MVADCGSKCAKFILFTFNILIWISGAVVLGVGIWFMVDDNALKFLHVATVDMDSDLMRGASIALVVVGALAFLVGFFGCCGACKENTCMLQTYAVILVFLIILQVAAGIAGAVFRGRISDEIAGSMNTTVQDLYQYKGTDETTLAFDLTQKEFKCCGVDAPSDWLTSDWKKTAVEEGDDAPVPPTCCVLNETDMPIDIAKCYAGALDITIPDAASYVHVIGCQESLHQWVDSHSLILIGVAIGLAVVQMFAVCLACCLRTKVQSEYTYV